MRLLNNLGYKVAALVLAAVFWAAAQGLGSGEESIDLPIALDSIPGDMVVVGQSAREVNLRLGGSRAALRRAVKGMERYTISLVGTKPPEARFAVTADRLSLPRGAEVLFRSPSTVVVQLENVSRKTVPIRADLIGQPPEGFRVGEVVVEPAEVQIEGARSQVRRISEVLTDRVDVSRMREPTDRNVRLVLGAGHVWRADRGQRVRLRIEIVPPVPAPGDRAPATTEPTAGMLDGKTTSWVHPATEG